jgi:lysophospholipase L1-like esterase
VASVDPITPVPLPPEGVAPAASTTRPARPSRARELALAAASVLLLLALTETGLRLAGWAPIYEKTRVRITNARDLAVRSRALVLDCYPSDPRRYFDIDLRQPAVRAAYAAQGVGRLAEFADTFPHAVEFRYNSAGFRDAEFRPRSPGVRRIVVLGDSFTEGQGVREVDTYPRVLEARLRSSGSGPWEVLNYGYRGQDLPALHRLFEQAQDLDPDLIVFGMVLNDAERDPTFDQRWPRLNDWIMLRRPTMALQWWRPRTEAWVRDRVETWRIGRETTAWYRELYGQPNAPGWARTKDSLRRMRRAQAGRGGGFLVALWPLMVGLEGAYPFENEHARIAAASQHARVDFRDLLPVLRGRRSADLWAHPADMHPNELAHRLVAEDLATWVLQSGAATRLASERLSRPDEAERVGHPGRHVQDEQGARGHDGGTPPP